MVNKIKINQTVEYKRFMKISEAAAYTGLPQNSIRQGCINGVIPYIKSGNAYMIDMEQFMAQLHEKASHCRGEVIYEAPTMKLRLLA